MIPSKNRSNNNGESARRTSHTNLLSFDIIVFITVTIISFLPIVISTHDFDYLVFSLRWLPSSCIEYKEKDSGVNFCVFYKNFNRWAIHGLWPTQNGHLGPFFCNKSDHFDIKALQPILTDLEETWPNIEGRKTVSSLWQHEWEKHGTCAEQLPLLDKEFKYFQATLNFFHFYDVQRELEHNSIFPSETNNLTVEQVFDAIKSGFGKNPHINCITEKKTKKPYLSEIRLCFNKNLQLIDCEENPNHQSGNVGKSITNCPLNKPIVLPNSVDPGPDNAINKDNLDSLKKEEDALKQEKTLKALNVALLLLKMLEVVG